MSPHVPNRSSTAAAVAFSLLDPIPFGMFVAALVFDAVYAKSTDVMWFKSAAWMISIGLLFAVVPRLINLFQVWRPGARPSSMRAKLSFLLYLLGVVAAIVNAFVHSRDAYAVMPDGLWLSLLTVALLVVATVLAALQPFVIDHKGQA